jgi:DNA (cytosine-5)-methyltransferase 1
MAWLISNNLMNSLCSQEPEVASLVGISLDGEQSVPSNGNLIQQAYCAPDKMTAFSRLSRFGMTYKPLTESLGRELLMLYREGFPARTLVPQEKAQELMESAAGCGEKWRASFTKYNPDSRLWKTHQCSLVEDLESFSETWPQWGLMRNGECWEQRTLEQTIRGIGYGLSPDNVKAFHTPNTTGLDGGSNSRKALKKRMENWPTPKVQDSRHAKMRHLKELDNHWKSNLGEVVSAQVNGGSLNPTWVEWLMGWPLEWTDLKPLEMDKYPCALQPHGESLGANNG